MFSKIYTKCKSLCVAAVVPVKRLSQFCASRLHRTAKVCSASITHVTAATLVGSSRVWQGFLRFLVKAEDVTIALIRSVGLATRITWRSSPGIVLLAPLSIAILFFLLAVAIPQLMAARMIATATILVLPTAFIWSLLLLATFTVIALVTAGVFEEQLILAEIARKANDMKWMETVQVFEHIGQLLAGKVMPEVAAV